MKREQEDLRDGRVPRVLNLLKLQVVGSGLYHPNCELWLLWGIEIEIENFVLMGVGVDKSDPTTTEP